MNQMSSLTVQDLAFILADSPDMVQLLDVRELQEVAIASLPHFIILPLSEYEQWSSKIMTELDPEKETIVMCHHGIRSAQMCQWLVHQGFQNVKNVSGGIDAYAVYVDDSLSRY
ncbi:rhodanese-like domain-containing protein [Cyanobacterium sp. IPPAS B-1200]|uniref:rhodanese-like domain-containing protein n=1 Tax=Cyanobacterium sp. IPPAS B-1200 TaxID=1562720 RepID=UPI0008526F49|nr:rhodanese-like domain-containing protein [Cyanobacterium sp. IPPAS B-1200]OEJ78647.1 rhodanese [Cyanobacterium sp. IPPAS B-1200]